MDLLLGDEAVGQGAIDASIRAAFSYPGTPATEIFEFIQNNSSQDRVAARWSANEKVAYEEALGVSYIGQRCIVSMKHVGLNVAADPFMSSSLTGAVGGLVVAVADDPGMHSSQNEQDTRHYAEFARLPLFEPCTQQECYDMVRSAFGFSEQLGVPVMIRLVTRLAHSRAAVERKPADAPVVRPKGKGTDWILLPPNARRRNRRMIGLQEVLRRRCEASPFNKLELRGSTGIIAAGITYNYVLEEIGDSPAYSVLKIGAYPIPSHLVRQLVEHCDDILVVEDGYPIIETQINGLLGFHGKMIRGRLTGALPPDGELSADLVRSALGVVTAIPRIISDPIPVRPPSLCHGCPHCDSFQMIADAVKAVPGAHLFGDIGCYTLGVNPPYEGLHTCVEMGASIGMGLGAAKAGAHPVICTIGDSTFTHSGMPSLLAAAHENANMTVVIMDNSGVAMTGGQDGFVTGEHFIRLLRGLGVDAHHIMQIDPIPKSRDLNRKLFQDEVAHRGLSVIIASRPCIHLKRRAAGPSHAAVGRKQAELVTTSAHSTGK
jgi:indolepyruvate ferredoxin oxidoreductase, alpha subunit